MNKYSNEQVLYFISLIRGDVGNINRITKNLTKLQKKLIKLYLQKAIVLDLDK